MFTVEKLVDSIQTGQRQFVETFVKNEEIRKSINELIDAQAQYSIGHSYRTW